MITGGVLGHLLLCALCYWLVREKGYDWPICLLVAIFGCLGLIIWALMPQAAARYRVPPQNPGV